MASFKNERFATSTKTTKNNQKQAPDTEDEKPDTLTATNNNYNNNKYNISQ